MEKNEFTVNQLKNKNVAVLGLGVSNLPLIDFLTTTGAKITAFDRKNREELGDRYVFLKKYDVEFSLGEKYLDLLTKKQFDFVFRTPGIRPDKKEILTAIDNGSILSSEIELVFKLAKCDIVGVTGSDGKTTTTTLISEMLKASGFNVHLGGNIGKPLIDEVQSYHKEDIIVLELSSFQLMGMTESPQFSLITNLSPNHLDYHLSYEEYCKAKYNIFMHQNSSNVLVINEKDSTSVKIKEKAVAEVLTFSMSKQVKGAFLEDDCLILNVNGINEEICHRKRIKLLGSHNIENILAASVIAYKIGASLEAIRSVATSFTGVKHRLEFIREVDGVAYYNDSIASSPSRAVAGIKSFDRKIILIAGGSDKYISFDQFGQEIAKSVKHLILMGKTKDKIESSVRKAMGKDKKLLIQRVENLSQAIYNAREAAESGDVVLLSPACASFDMFNDFEQRGDTFREIVESL